MCFLRLGAHRRVNTVGSEQDIVVSKVMTHPLYPQPTQYIYVIHRPWSVRTGKNCAVLETEGAVFIVAAHDNVLFRSNGVYPSVGAKSEETHL